jgi:hypothetical protein
MLSIHKGNKLSKNEDQTPVLIAHDLKNINLNSNRSECECCSEGDCSKSKTQDGTTFITCKDDKSNLAL